MTSSDTMYLIFHGRFPSKKAHSIFVAKGAEAFAKERVAVKLLVPSRKGVAKEDPFEWYKLERIFSIVKLWTIDIFNTPFKQIAFRLSLLVFSITSFFYVIFDQVEGKKMVYTNENLPVFLFGLFSPYKVVYELHDFPESNIWFYKVVFAAADKIIATNAWKGREVERVFNVSPEKIFVELNAVDVSQFRDAPSKEIAREQLGIQQDALVCVYTGHFYSWKGTETLFAAAKMLPHISFYFIGGTQKDVAKKQEKYGDVPNVHIVGHRPHADIPVWQSAADVLVLPNTAKEKISKYYTSPMKLFEYMASERPIVASDLPSVREIGGEEELYLVKPDDAKALAEGIEQALIGGEQKLLRAKGKIQNHSWGARAGRILRHIS